LTSGGGKKFEMQKVGFVERGNGPDGFGRRLVIECRWSVLYRAVPSSALSFWLLYGTRSTLTSIWGLVSVEETG
jgi:hypothetical protein